METTNTGGRYRTDVSEISDEQIGVAYTSDFAWNLLDELAEIGSRMAGHEGEAEGALAVKRAFEDAGLRESEISEFSIPGWWRGESSLAVETSSGRSRAFSADYEVLGLPGSPAEVIEAPIVDVDPGLPADFEDADVDGKIVLVGSQNPASYGRGINRIEKYSRAVDAGATGFVYYNDMTDGAIPTTGTVGFGHELPGSIPAVGVSREVGNRLKRYLREGEVTATLDVECRNGDATCRNVEAVVGPDDGPEVLVTGHVDAHDIAEGVRDNGAGTVIAAEVGRILANVEDDLDTRVRVIAFGGEETGLFGSKHWAATHDLDEVVGQVNMDGIGFSRDLAVSGLGLLNTFEEVSNDFHGSISQTSKASPFNDHWPFVREGVPSVTCRSTTGVTGQVVRYGNVEWGHTHADTLDKLDPRDLRDLAIPIASAVHACANRRDEVVRLDGERVRDSIPPGLAEYLQLDGRWPW